MDVENASLRDTTGFPAEILSRASRITYFAGQRCGGGVATVGLCARQDRACRQRRAAAADTNHRRR